MAEEAGAISTGVPDAEKAEQEWRDITDAVSAERVSLALCRRSSAEKCQTLREQTYADILEIANLVPTLQDDASTSADADADNGGDLADAIKSVNEASKGLAVSVKTMEDLLSIRSVMDGKTAGGS